MSLTIDNTAAVEAVSAAAPVQPLAKRMEQEHRNAMGASSTSDDAGATESIKDLPEDDTEPVVPDQDDESTCDRAEQTPREDSSDEADGFIERVAADPATREAMLAMRPRPVSVPKSSNPAPPPTVATLPSDPQPEADDTLAPRPQPENTHDRSRAATLPSPTDAPAPGSVETDGTVAERRSVGRLALNPLQAGAEAPRVSDAPNRVSRAPVTESASTPGRHEGSAMPLPALSTQDAAARHSAETAAGEAGQARSEANTANQRNLQHVQQAQKTAEVLARRASAGARMDVAFTSWGPGNSVAIARQLGGHWTATPSNARVGQALGSSTTPDGLQVRLAGENLRVESGGTTDPDGRRRQQQEQDTP